MNVIQLALAAEDFFQQQPAIRFSEGQCVHTKYTNASCAVCAETCPTGAITLTDTIPTLDAEHCIKCGVCLHTCPVGAFERGDGLYHLLNCTECILNRDTLDIACVHHPAAEKADRGTDAVIQINNCLSELGPSAYIGLKALGVKHVRVRLDACGDCPLRVLEPQIEHSVRQAQRLLAAFDLEDGLTLVQKANTRWRKRPLHQSKNPPLSRRGFFTMLAGGNTATARVIVPVQDHTEDTRHTSRERRRLLNALRVLVVPSAEASAKPGTVPDAPPAVRLESDGFVQLAVKESCTACGLCERVCPVGALHVDKTGATFAVTFAPHLCTACGLCVDYCEAGALHTTGGPAARDVLEGTELALHSGTLRECSRCKTLFAGDRHDQLCTVCRHRYTRTSDNGLPEPLLAKLPPATRMRLKERLAKASPSDTEQSHS